MATFSPSSELSKPVQQALASADILLREIIRQVELIVNTPTREWDTMARIGAMEHLVRTADQALSRLNDWTRSDIQIKHIYRFIGSLQLIRSEARHASLQFGGHLPSRVTGRVGLKQQLGILTELLGSGTEALLEETLTQRLGRAELLQDSSPKLAVVTATNGTDPEIKRALAAADTILREVRRQTHVLVTRLLREWEVGEQKAAMEQLARTADHALAWLNSLKSKDIEIKNLYKFIACVESSRSEALAASRDFHARRGKAQLKRNLDRMTTLLGNGMELVEPVKVEPVFGEPWRPDTPKLTIVNSAPQPSQKSDALVAPNDRPYTVNDLMVLHNLSRATVIRLYENEPDVLILQASREHQRKIGRRYRTIRVPPKVYRRVKQRMENR